MKKIRVLLADDHRMFLAGLQRLLEPDFEVVGAVEDGRALLAAADRLQPDVIVADISMPLLNGIDALRQLQAGGSNAKFLFLTMHGDSLFLREALRLGASGYVLKRDAPDQLIAAIRRVARGKSYVAPDLIRGAVLESPGQDSLPTLDRLTPRQREVLQLVAEGKSLKEIAAAIHISVKTVEFHKYNLMQQLGARSNAELTTIALRHGLVSV